MDVGERTGGGRRRSRMNVIKREVIRLEIGEKELEQDEGEE